MQKVEGCIMSNAILDMNGTIWIFALLLIFLVLFQSFLFLRLALKFNQKNHLLSKEELKSAARTGAIAAVGPSFSSIVIALSLISMVGSAATFMRCGVIGAPSWELYLASIASSTTGIDFGSPEFTENIFTLCLFCMITGSIPFFLNTLIMLKPLDLLIEKSKEKKREISFLPYLSSSAAFGLLGYMIMGYFSSKALVGAAVGSIIGYLCFDRLVKRTGRTLLGSFSLAAAMVIGMTAGEIITMLGS